MEPKHVSTKYPFQFVFTDYPDPTSWSLLVWLIGCEHFCKECQNQSLQQINPNNKDQTIIHTNTLIRLINDTLQKEKCNEVVLSGGDPLFGNNLYFTKKFCIEYGNKINIALYTGYSIDYVKEQGILNFKYIKCNKFDESLKLEPYKNDYEMQLASSNQEWYDSNYKQISKNGLLKFF